MHYLVTGHTGFKGAWLTLLLTERGHTVSGVALDPEPGALFDVARLSDRLANDVRADIRDPDAVTRALALVRPDAVFHLAAQPLVRESYRDPRWTVETNVMGTFNVLEAIRSTPSVSASVVVTTDKVYRNVNQVAGYVERDPLGGHDPYSASKAMADLLTQSWVASFGGPPTAIARAGNVIGGGDVCKDRLLPDLLRSFAQGRAAEIRYPESVRPWQHVLDCLHGYVLLMDALLDGTQSGGEWNFGPGPESFMTVSTLADLAVDLWGEGAAWTTTQEAHPHEAGLLALDASKARAELNWFDALVYPTSVEWTITWARRHEAGEDAEALSREQLAAFTALVRERGGSLE